MGGIFLDLSEKFDFVLAEVEGRNLFDDLVFGEKLGKLEVEGAGYFLQGFERGHGVAVFDARKIAAEEAGALFDVALGHLLLQAEVADGGTDVSRDGLHWGGNRLRRKDYLHVSH